MHHYSFIQGSTDRLLKRKTDSYHTLVIWPLPVHHTPHLQQKQQHWSCR